MTLTGIAFLLGVLAGQFSTTLLSINSAAVLMLAALLFGWRLPHGRHPAAALFGFAWLCLFAQLRLADALPHELQGEDLLIRGHVVGLPTLQHDRTRFQFQIESAQHGEQRLDMPLLTRIAWYRGESPRAGERWQLLVRLKRPRGLANPGGFDYASWLFRHGIRATGYVRDGQHNQRLAGHASSQWLHRTREWLGERLSAALPDARQPGLLRALSLGQRDRISPELWEQLRATGTNHLVAISGLHIGLIAGGFAWLASLVWRFSPPLRERFTRPGFAAAMSLPAAIAYAALAGFALPTQRALIMLTIVIATLLLRRHIGLWRGWSLALLAVLLFDPLAPMGVDFWLSFGAVATIIFAFQGRLASASQWRHALRLQVAVSLGLLPLTLLFFQHGSIVSPLANLIAVPLVGLLLVPLVLLGALLAAVDPSWASGILWLGDMLADHLVLGLGWLAEHPISHWQQAAPSPIALGLALLGIAIMLSPARLLPRWLLIPLCLPALFSSTARPPHGQFELHLPDVGQGLSVVIQTKHHALLFDAGARFSARFDAGSAVVLPFLQQLGITRLDVAIASHGDNDHRGGLPAVLAAVPTNRLLTGFNWRDSPQESTACRTGQQWHWDGVHFEILHPAEAMPEGNNASCVLLITAANGSRALVPGDIEESGEAMLLARGIAPVELLIAPHHGSKTSSSEALLTRLQPQVALFPIGHRNRYGFPHPAVQARYDRLGVRSYRSDRDGALSFRLGEPSDGHQPRLLQRSRDTRRYWQDVWVNPRKSSIIAPLERP